jgi:predicted acylesterase/phospholipase RssA
MARALPAERIELRLALVCYGGVSLAVYMHGVTKELHKLVQASRRFDRDGDLDAANPFGEDESARAYYAALQEIAEAGRHLSVSIDVIAGTSAGGINGVVLGRCWPGAAPRSG